MAPAILEKDIAPPAQLGVARKPALHPLRLRGRQFSVEKGDEIGIGRPPGRHLGHRSLTLRRRDAFRSEIELAEGFARRGEPAHDGSDRHLEHLGRVAVGQSFNIDQEKRLPLRLGKRLHPSQHLTRQYIRFDLLSAFECQAGFSVDHPLALANSAGPKLVQPDRTENREEPTVEPGAQGELARSLERADTSRLNEILGDVTPSRENEPVAPEAGQVLTRPALTSS